jgi:hypothetical protein
LSSPAARKPVGRDQGGRFEMQRGRSRTLPPFGAIGETGKSLPR